MEKTLKEWIIAEARILKPGGMAYFMGPCGIGCGLDEALSVYGAHVIPGRAKTDRGAQETRLLWPTKNGGLKPFARLWRA